MPNSSEILNKLKQRGHWSFRVHPLGENAKVDSLTDCKEVVKDSVVRLRGWMFPYDSSRNTVETHDNYIQMSTDSLRYYEVWRMYPNGFFIDNKALYEDWIDYDTSAESDTRFRDIETGEVLFFENTTLVITEMVEFAFRYIDKLKDKDDSFSDDKFKLELVLRNTEGRRLMVQEFMRGDFLQNYQFSGNELSCAETVMPSTDKTSREVARDLIVCLFDKFGWEDINLDAISDLQDKMYNRAL